MIEALYMRDRLLRGGLAGVIGGLWLIGWNAFSRYILSFAKTTWLDALNQVILAHPIKNAGDFVVAFIETLTWNGALGAIFIRLVVPKREGNYLGRAIGFGFVCWFVLLAIGTLYKIPFLNKVAWQTAMSNWIGVIGYGLILGWLTKRWDNVETEKSS